MPNIVIADFRRKKSRIQGTLVKENTKTVLMELPACYRNTKKHIKRHKGKHDVSVIELA